MTALAAAALVLIPSARLSAQSSQFVFDPNGNLAVQSPALNAAPTLIGQPQTRVVGPGGTASFFVVAHGSAPLAYQWRFNGADLAGETGETLVVPAAIAGHEGAYAVVVSNPSGSVTSAPAFLLLDTDHDGLGDAWELTHFGDLEPNASGDADGDRSTNLREFQNGTNPTDANSYAFRLLVISDAGTVLKSPDQPAYTNGQSVTLTAVPYPNGNFHAWLGDVVTRTNPLTLVMTNDQTVYARFTPILFTWASAASGDWDSAENWSPHLVPDSLDSVIINRDITVTLNTSADCTDVNLGNTASNPTLTGSGTLRVHGNLTWASGVMSGNGRTVIAPEATLNLVNAGPVLLDARTLENGGAASWTSEGAFLFSSGAILTNCFGAVFLLSSGAQFGAPAGVNRIDNVGTFHKAIVANAVTVPAGLSFNNDGEVRIEAGTLRLAGGGAHKGAFHINSGATLDLGGNHDVRSGAQITGAGNFAVSGGTANLAGLLHASGPVLFSNAAVNVTGNWICTNNTLTVTDVSGGRTANFSGTGLVTPAALNLSQNGTVGGSGQITILQTMNWTGGTMTGSGRTVLGPGATLFMPGSSTLGLAGRTLENSGTILWKGAATIAMSGGAVITNLPGAMFDAQNTGQFFNFFSGLSRVDNAGTFRKSVLAGTTSVGSSIQFNNYGTVEIQSGQLMLSGGGSHRGTFAIGPDTSLVLAGGIHDAAPGSSITGSGDFAVTGGAANLAGRLHVRGSHLFSNAAVNVTGEWICTNNTLTVTDVSGGRTANFSGTGLVTPAALNLSQNGTLGGSGQITVLQTMNWSGGAMTGNGRTVVGPGATLFMPGSSTLGLAGRTLENSGTILWTGPATIAMSAGAVITNLPGAVFDAQNTGQFFNFFSGLSRVDNAGTFRKSVLAGTTSVGSSIQFNNYGTVEIQRGILAANGGFTFSPGARLHCSLGGTLPGTGYGQLQIPGGTTVAGVLSVDFAPDFSAATTDAFSVLTAGSRSGAFASFVYPSNAYTLLLTNTPTAVVVRSVGPAFATANSLPEALRFAAYTQQVVGVSGATPIAFELASGSLPSGLTLSSAGLIAGVPTVRGLSQFTIRIRDAAGAVNQQTFSLRVVEPALAPPGLISWWRAEGNALDSANRNHGTTSNGVTYLPGKVGQAFRFDGLDDFVWVPDATNLRPASLTLETWAQFNGAQGAVLGRAWGSAVHNSYGIWQLGGNVHGTIGDTNQSAAVLNAPLIPEAGRWYHVALTFDNVTKEQALYLDGLRVDAGPSPRTIGYDSHPLILGGDIDNGAVSFLLNGAVDEAAIYNRALTASEIAGIFEAGSAGKQLSVPYAQWKEIFLGDRNAPDFGDPDGDGLTNAAEYEADTNPTNALSLLRITSVTVVPGGLDFTWEGGIRSTQILQRRLGLGPADVWQEVFTNPPPTINPVRLNLPPTTNSAFYRLRVAR